ncbi:MAG: phosphotransferase [Steroidobacteraceae bacterium]
MDRDLECELQSLAATAGLAPRIVATDAAHRFLVSELAPGRRWSAAQMRDPAALRRLGAVLARLHGIAVPVPLVAAARAAPTLLERVQAQARALGGAAADAARIDGRTLPAVLEHAEADFARAGLAPRPAVVHSDAHHANLVEGEHLLLIDWEYAHVGDPLEDLASLLAAEPAILEQRRAEELLVDFGLEQRADAAMLAALVRVFRSLNALWQCRAQRIDPPCAGAPSTAAPAPS